VVQSKAFEENCEADVQKFIRGRMSLNDDTLNGDLALEALFMSREKGLQREMKRQSFKVQMNFPEELMK
jgi:hypothetical protein